MRKWMGFAAALGLLAAVFLVLPIRGEAAVYDRVIRLHVLAESDSEADQAVKFRVRDAVLEETDALLAGAATREEAEAILSAPASLEAVRQCAEDAARAAGSDCTVAVTLGRERYPTRVYERLAFPAGEYLSLRVLLGEAKGKNWWCVLFPPLCLSAASAAPDTEAAFLAAGLTGEQYRMIADTDSTRYRLRFKILEVAESLFD